MNMIGLVFGQRLFISMIVRVFGQKLFHKHHGASIWSNALL